VQLPEAEILRKDLEKDVVGKRVKDVTVKATSVISRHRSKPEFVKALSGRKIEGLHRRGTALVFDLDDGAALVVRLGSQGTVMRASASADAGKSTQVVATFTTGGAMHIVDPAKDGDVFVVDAEQRAGVDDLSPKGIDPLNDTFTWPAFNDQLKARAAPLKTVLVDDTFIVGLGDLYSDEILWAAGLSGTRSSAGLSAQEVRRLYRAVQEVLHEAVKQGGAEDSSDSASDDDEAEYSEFVKVYGREGLPCARCRQPIRHSVLDGGLPSYHCANCQT
jgi:formamidopyrimidine-DNA glycosylase